MIFFPPVRNERKSTSLHSPETSWALAFQEVPTFTSGRVKTYKIKNAQVRKGSGFLLSL